MESLGAANEAWMEIQAYPQAKTCCKVLFIKRDGGGEKNKKWQELAGRLSVRVRRRD